MRKPCAAAATVVVLGVASLSAPTAAAAGPACTVTWVGPDRGGWESPSSWRPARVPGPTDVVCLRTANPPAVTVNASTTVAGLVAGAANVAVAGGAALTVTGQLLVVGGTLAGPGTIRAGDPGARTCCTSTGSITGPARLTRRAHLDTGPGTFTVVGGLGFSGGSVLDNSGQLVLSTDAVFTDDDGDPRNLFHQSRSSFAATTTQRRVRIEVAATISGDVGAYGGPNSNLALSRLTDETPDGELRGVTLRGTGTITIPYPVSTLRDATVYPPGVAVAASTGRPALAATLRTVVDGGVTVFPAFTAGNVLTFARSSLTAYAVLSARALVLADASSMTLLDNGSISLQQGAGSLTVRPDTGNGPVTVQLAPGIEIDASVDQQGGELAVSDGGGGARITGDWTLGGAARVTVGIDRYRGSVPAGRITVRKALELDGTLVLTADRRTPPVGTAIAIITAAGGITGTFRHVTLPPGYALTYATTAVVATYTG